MPQPRPRHLTLVLAMNALISIALFVAPVWAQSQVNIVSAGETHATLITAVVSAVCFLPLTFMARQGVSTFMWAVRIGGTVLCLVYAILFLVTPPAGISLLELALAAPLLTWAGFLNWYLHRAPVCAFYQRIVVQGQAKR